MAKEKKKKKWWAKLLTFLLVMFILLATPVVTIYVLFYDGKAKYLEPSEIQTTGNLFKDRAVDALNGVKEKEALVFTISENDINQIMANNKDAVTNALPVIEKFYKGMEVTTGDEEYIFAADGELTKFFKTRIVLTTKLSKEDINGEEALVFNVVNIKMGRITVKKDNYFIKKYVNDDFLAEMLKGLGMSFVVDFKDNSRIYYPKSSIAKDMNIFDSTSGGSFYDTVIDEYFNQGLLSVNANKDGFSGVINLKPVHTNDNFVSHEYENDAEFEVLKAVVKQVLQNSDLTDEEGIDLYRYLIIGFSRMKPEVQEFIQALDLTSVGISDPTLYEGIILNYDGLEHPGYIVRPEKEIFTKVNEQVDTTLADVPLPKDSFYTNRAFATISEKDLSATLASSDSIGNPYLFTHRSNDGTYSVCAFTIDNMYANIYDNSLKLTLGLNVNGYETYICINTEFKNAEEYQFNFTINEVYYGEKQATERFTNEIKKMVFEALKDDKVVGYNQETNVLSFTIGSALEEGQKAKVAEYGVTHEITGSSVSDEGKLIYRLG